MGCTYLCWTAAPCPVCGRPLQPHGRSLPFEVYQDDCCRAAPNRRHLFDEHDSDRRYFDPEGWDAHKASCEQCNPKEDL